MWILNYVKYVYMWKLQIYFSHDPFKEKGKEKRNSTFKSFLTDHMAGKFALYKNPPVICYNPAVCIGLKHAILEGSFFNPPWLSVDCQTLIARCGLTICPGLFFFQLSTTQSPSLPGRTFFRLFVIFFPKLENLRLTI